MKKVAKFEKVSYEEFKNSIQKCFWNRYLEHEIKNMYNNIKLPTRATKGSAGYDFHTPLKLNINKTDQTVIPTGIRVRIDDGWVLKIYPRSGLGFKYKLSLCNTVGIIDGDYYNSDNEGHIMIKVGHDEGDYVMPLEQGQGFAQGIFVEYGITEDDDVESIRNGGFGSTDNK